MDCGAGGGFMAARWKHSGEPRRGEAPGRDCGLDVEAVATSGVVILVRGANRECPDEGMGPEQGMILPRAGVG